MNDVAVCPNCEIYEDGVFCRECGAPVRYAGPRDFKKREQNMHMYWDWWLKP